MVSFARCSLQKGACSLAIFLWAFSVGGSDRLQEHSDRASRAMRRRDFSAAEKEYRAILAIAPQLAEIRSNLGLALHMQDKFEQAEREFRQALRENPKLFVPNYFLGIQLFKTNRYKEAKTHLESALSLEPSVKEVRYRLAATYVGLKEYDEAIRQYREILEQDPHEVDAHYSMGKIFNQLMEDSVRELSRSPNTPYYGLMLIEALEGGEEWRSIVDTEIPKIIQARPSVSNLHYELGRLRLREGKMDTARDLFRDELAVDPWSYQARYGLSQIELASGRYGDFAEELERAVAIRPEFFCPPPSLIVKIPAADLETAIEHCDTLLAQEFLAAQLARPNSLCDKLAPYTQKLAVSDGDLGNSAETLFQEKRYEAVISRLESGSKQPSRDASQLMAAQAYLETGQLEIAVRIARNLSHKPEVEDAAQYLLSRACQRLALQSLMEIERVAPDSYRAHQLKGGAYMIRNNMREAIVEFNASLDRHPEDAEVLYQLGRAHYYLAEFHDAFEALEKSLQLDPYNAEANFILGEGKVHTQAPEKALPFLTRALELDPSMVKAHEELGKAFLQMSRWEDAVKELELASSIDQSGELYYQLFRAYSKLKMEEKAQRALSRSNKLRQEKIKRERARIASHQQP
jgi:tetratricopeptide (TPR) repeat protein